MPISTPPPIRLRLLGGFDLSHHAAQPVAALTRKTQALLAFLALSCGRPVRRDKLADLFWGLHGEERARNNLRQSLSAIRNVMGPLAPALAQAGRDTVVIDPDALDVDALIFERQVCADNLDQRRSAVDLYQGDLLAGFEGIAAPAFQAWRNAEAGRLKGLAVTALLALLRQAEAEDEAGTGAETLARRLLAIDSLQEPAHRALIRRHARLGQPALALEQYAQCRVLLQRHLGIGPSTETEALRRSFSDDGAPVPRSDGTVRQDPPSVLVLPFTSLGNDPDEHVFALGIAEEITHALARIRWFHVLARSSALAPPKDELDDQRIGHLLGAHYVLTGTIRRAGQRRRITGRLLNVASGRHIWSDRFEGSADDVFVLQDAVTRAVVTAIEPSLERAEMDRVRRAGQADSELYGLLFRSVSLRVAMTPAASTEALMLLRRALALDPSFVPARAHLLLCYTQRVSQGWEDADEIEEGIALARAAFVEHGDDPLVLECVALTLITLALDADGALDAANRALALHPHSSWIHNAAGWANIHAGNADAATHHLAETIRLNPFDPEVGYSYAGLGLAHILAGRPEEGLAWAQRALRERPTLAGAHRAVLTALVELGRSDEAVEAARAFRRIAPHAARVSAEEVLKAYRNPAQAEMVVRARRAAGLPE